MAQASDAREHNFGGFYPLFLWHLGLIKSSGVRGENEINKWLLEIKLCFWLRQFFAISVVLAGVWEKSFLWGNQKLLPTVLLSWKFNSNKRWDRRKVFRFSQIIVSCWKARTSSITHWWYYSLFYAFSFNGKTIKMWAVDTESENIIRAPVGNKLERAFRFERLAFGLCDELFGLCDKI